MSKDQANEIENIKKDLAQSFWEWGKTPPEQFYGQTGASAIVAADMIVKRLEAYYYREQRKAAELERLRGGIEALDSLHLLSDEDCNACSDNRDEFVSARETLIHQVEILTTELERKEQS